jgi:hypothetical protein
MRGLLSSCLVTGSLLLLGCTDSADPTAAGQMVYFDTQSREAVVYETGVEFPVTHPVTQQPTLMPALYCTRCQTWRPVPPADQINRRPGAANCGTCQVPLSIDGPWPDKHLDSADAQK